MKYLQKYLKYKKKYITLKDQYGGTSIRVINCDNSELTKITYSTITQIIEEIIAKFGPETVFIDNSTKHIIKILDMQESHITDENIMVVPNYNICMKSLESNIEILLNNKSNLYFNYLHFVKHALLFNLANQPMFLDRVKEKILIEILHIYEDDLKYIYAMIETTYNNNKQFPYKLIFENVNINILTNVIIYYFNKTDTNNNINDFLNLFIKSYFDNCNIQTVKYNNDQPHYTGDFTSYSSNLKRIIPYISDCRLDIDLIKPFILKSIKLNHSLYSLLNCNIKNDIDIISFVSLYNKSIFIQNKDLHTNKLVIDAITKNHGLSNLYDSNSRLVFLHIAICRLNIDNTESYINYMYVMFKKESIETIKVEIIKYINSSNNTVIFLDINDIDSISLYTSLNDYIKTCNTNKENIKIINRYYYDDNVLFYNKNFYKIINILFVETEQRPSKYTLLNDQGYIVINKLKKDECTDNCNMLATHWINWLINSPIFVKYRQYQISSTCWLNTIINSLILVPKIKEELYIKYKALKSSSSIFQLSFDDIINNNKYSSIDDVKITIKNIFYSIIGNLHCETLDTQNFFKDDDNYIQVLGAYLKSTISSFSDEFKNLGAPITHPLYRLCKSTDDNNFRSTICKSKNEINITKLQNICNYNICDAQLTSIQQPDKKLEYSFGDYSGPTLILDLLNIIFDINIRSTLLDNIKIQLSKIEILITKSNPTDFNYTLCSSYLHAKEGNIEHVICGIINNDIDYVYDSSSHIITQQNWNDLSFEEYKLLECYKNKLIEKHQTDEYLVYFKPAYFIYIKDTSR